MRDNHAMTSRSRIFLVAAVVGHASSSPYRLMRDGPPARRLRLRPLELAGEKVFHAIIIHNEHNHIDRPPIWSPKLPPVTRKNAGALQPLGVRQLATPRP